MLFRELVFKDFLVFKGENRIIFPPPSQNDSCLVLVLAPNSGGKTSIIRALEFLLYGRLRREMPPSADGLINKSLTQATRVGTTIEAWVQAKIEINGHSQTIRRRIETTRTGAASFRSRIILEATVHARRGDVFQEDEGSIQRTLERLVPQPLFDYFYFQGETLAARQRTQFLGKAPDDASGVMSWNGAPDHPHGPSHPCAFCRIRPAIAALSLHKAQKTKRKTAAAAFAFRGLQQPQTLRSNSPKL